MRQHNRWSSESCGAKHTTYCIGRPSHQVVTQLRNGFYIKTLLCIIFTFNDSRYIVKMDNSVNLFNFVLIEQLHSERIAYPCAAEFKCS